MLVCLLDAPHLDLPEQASGAEDVVLEEPILSLVMLELELEMAVLGEPTLPFGKVTSWSSSSKLLLPEGLPQGVG